MRIKHYLLIELHPVVTNFSGFETIPKEVIKNSLINPFFVNIKIVIK